MEVTFSAANPAPMVIRGLLVQPYRDRDSFVLLLKKVKE